MGFLDERLSLISPRLHGNGSPLVARSSFGPQANQRRIQEVSSPVKRCHFLVVVGLFPTSVDK